jgi:ribosome biogenesis GTPase
MVDPRAPSLGALGWDDRLAALAAAAECPGSVPGRVARVDLGLATVLTEAGTVRATPGDDPLATGDWVLVEGERVVAVLPRRTAFVRGDPMEGRARDAQVVAANVDIVLVVQSLTNGPNLRRLERELVLAFESGAMPVVVLTKADLVAEDAIAAAAELASAAAPALDVLVTSTVTRRGVDEVRALAAGGRTLALIGASGVGKSTLVNALVGREVQEIGDVRAADQRGRHTTTARELVLVPGGGVLVDTPGLRAVSLWEADEGLSRTFADIEELAGRCRFRDCSHRGEPGCEVRAAIERGELDPARYENYLRLDAELDAAERRRQGRIMSRAARRWYEDHPKRR